MRACCHHVGVYAYTPDALARWVALPVHPLERIERLEQLRPLAHGMRMGVAIVDVRRARRNRYRSRPGAGELASGRPSPTES